MRQTGGRDNALRKMLVCVLNSHFTHHLGNPTIHLVALKLTLIYLHNKLCKIDVNKMDLNQSRTVPERPRDQSGCQSI